MEKFGELFVKCSPEHTAEFISAVENALQNGWTRAPQNPEQTETLASVDDYLAVTCDRRQNREAALLAIARKDAETLYVCNVILNNATALPAISTTCAFGQRA